MARAGLGYLSACDAASLGTPVQAEALIGLEQAEAQHTAARAKMLAAFSAQQGHHADGQYGPASWLRAFTSVTNGAATAAVTWARRLAAHWPPGPGRLIHPDGTATRPAHRRQNAYAASSTHGPGPATVTPAARHLAVLYLA
jgi:hypothetical protein